MRDRSDLKLSLREYLRFTTKIGAVEDKQELVGKIESRKSVEIENGYDFLLIAAPQNAFKGIDFSKFASPILDTRNVVGKKAREIYAA